VAYGGALSGPAFRALTAQQRAIRERSLGRTPQPVAATGAYARRGMTSFGDFLESEAGATARLMSFYRAQRLEILDFLTEGNPTLADQRYYTALQDKAGEIIRRLDAGSADWVKGTVAPAFATGARGANPHLKFTALHDLAVKALAGDTLALIQATNAGIRRAIQQAVSAGILSGLSPAELRQRIIESGLAPGPWKNVETRAGVIARTETMRAYNAGNLAGTEATGAAAVEWIASPDEATCPTCRPRDGIPFAAPWITEGTRARTSLPPVGDGIPGPRNEGVKRWGRLPEIPAHPRCRCTTGAIYFGPSGEYLTKNPEPPAVGEGEPAAPGGEPTPANPRGMISDADFAKGLDMLRNSDRFDYASASKLADFWKGSGGLTRAQTEALSASGEENVRAFFEARYGVTAATNRNLGGWNPDRDTDVLHALERFRSMNPEFVTDNPYLQRIRWLPRDPKAAASMSTEGQMTVYVEGYESWLRHVQGESWAAPAGGRYTQTVIEHELGHMLHNVNGIYYDDPVYGSPVWKWTDTSAAGTILPTRSLQERGDLWTEWRDIHQGSIAWNDRPSLDRVRRDIYVAEQQLRNARDMVDYYGPAGDRALAESGRLSEANAAGRRREFASYTRKAKKLERELERKRKELADIEAGRFAQGADYQPSEYAGTNVREDFAESTAAYLDDPEWLRRWSPKRYAFLRRIMGG
jgi:hypothetical protein